MIAIYTIATGKVTSVVNIVDASLLTSEQSVVEISQEFIDELMKGSVIKVVSGEIVLDNAPAWSTLRAVRNEKLTACDWTQLSDIPSETKTLWASYRQELRNLPENTTDPFNPVWPTAPVTEE